MKTPFPSNWALALGLLVLPSLALAHPGHVLASANAGFLHPFSGLDHLLAMLAVGLWAGRLGGAARWQLPLMFMAVMMLGALTGLAGSPLPGLETGIAASVLALGLILAMRLSLQRPLQLGLVGLFALLHGWAHGGELGAQAAALVGMLLATGLLHGLGLLLAYQRFALAETLQRTLGAGIAVSGTWMLLA